MYMIIYWYTHYQTLHVHITSLYVYKSESSDSLNSAVLWNDGKPFQNPWTIVFLDVKNGTNMAPSHDTPGPYIENAVRDEFPEGLLATQIYATLGSTDSSTEHPVRILQKYISQSTHIWSVFYDLLW